MDVEEELQYTQYFYNSVIEFVYFIIICVESRGFLFLNIICKHIKFFKVEVSELISSFHGNTLEEKLCNMLNILKCFVLTKDRIKINKSMYIKNSIFDDLILSKSVDLVLKGITSVDKICKNLNCSSVIFVEKKYLMNLFKKSSHFSIEKDFVALHHIHGVIAFDRHSCNSVTNYFQNILQSNKTLSFDEIIYHSKFVSCGMQNILAVFCILYCNKHFQCESSHILLRKVFKNYPKFKPLNIELLAQDMSSTSPTIGEMIHHKYGSRIKKWVGEISALTDWSGCIYCVVDFTNGGQGVFRVYFTKTSLKEISEISSLKDYFSVRDKVQFDAEYVESKNPDRCWKGSRIKALKDAKLHYDETILDKLKLNSEVQRKYCSNKNCFGVSCMNYLNSDINSYNENLFPKMNENKIDKYFLASEKLSKESIPNFHILDYMFMFGFVFMVMEDKGIAISEHESKFYTILFMKDSMYARNKSKINPVKGQKVLLFVPFLGELESIYVATLAYGLTENEIEEIDEKCITPKDFALHIFLPSITGSQKCKKSCCNVLNSFLTYQPKNFIVNEQKKMKILEMYDFIQSHYKVIHKKNFVNFLNDLCKGNSDCKNISDKIIQMVIKLTKSAFTQCISHNKSRIKFRKKIKKNKISIQPYEKNNLSSNFCSSSKKTDKTMSVSDVDVTVKYDSLDVPIGSYSSLDSYKSCKSQDSSETFYSCDSEQDTQSSDSLDSTENNRKTPSEIPSKEEPLPCLTVLNSDCILRLSNLCENLELKPEMKLVRNKCRKSNRYKYFSLQSFPVLKHTVRKKRRVNVLCHTKHVCQNCYKSSLIMRANITLISESFIFYNVNLCGCNVILPVPRKILPKNLEEKFKLDSCCEIIIVPNTPVNLSRISAINLIY